MTLEDFLTSTELKDGLTTPSRVNDLLTVMHNEKEDDVKNIAESTRQWSAVATAIATTENKECLDLFIQLDGLWFINRWLNDAQNFVNDDGNNFSENLILALLRALETLHVDNRMSADSGIGKTVQGLVGHSSSMVREKAKALRDLWARIQDIDPVSTDVNSVVSSGGNENEENIEQSGDQQKTDKEEILTPQEIIMDSESETKKLENEKAKSETTAVTGNSNRSEDVNEEDVDSLTNLSTEVENAMECATKTEMKEDTSEKDEDMVDGGGSPDVANPKMSAIGDSGGGGLEEAPDADIPKTTSSSESDDDKKKDDEIESGDEEGNDEIESGDEENGDEENDSGTRSRVSKRSTNGQNGDLISNRPSDMELDYGMVDPLELARQVAIEVEQEVDSPEQSCSTSTNEVENQSTGGSGKEVSSGPGPGPGPVNDVETHGTKIPEMGQESAVNAEKGFSGFDLNQEFSSEETDSQVDPVLTPISVVSASRAAAANGPPVAPLQFEGSLGWKGSAATSAFRRIPESEKTFSPSSSQNNSNPRLNRLDFDLNVAEGSEDKIEFDLNSLGDGDGGIISFDWKSPSVSSSSSSMQPSYRNFDLNLNDHSNVSNNVSFDNPFLGKLLNNKRDESVISILGKQVEITRKDYIPPPPPQPNGRIFDPSIDFSLGRPGSGLGLGSSLPYANLPAYSYNHNGFAMGPMYGAPSAPGPPFPYMVDSRGGPILPSIQPAFPQPTQPFFFNMAATGGSNSNGAGPSRNNLDLNSGFLNEIGNRENNGNMGLRQFLNHNHNQASSSSVIGGKREEPDSGWELFPINYKHQQPPWQ